MSILHRGTKNTIPEYKSAGTESQESEFFVIRKDIYPGDEVNVLL